MASWAGGVIQDQNSNIHYNEPSAGWNASVAKGLKKGGLGARTPLGDLSNSLKPSLNQTVKKQNGSSHVPPDASKKKSTSKAKVQISGRKALSDISNSVRPNVNEVLKPSHSTKQSVVTEERVHSSAIVEEQFKHNHEECIKAQTRGLDLDQFLQILGLDKDVSKQLKNPWTDPMSAIEEDELELEEISEPVLEDLSVRSKFSDDLDYSLTCASPVSTKYSLLWDDEDYIDFKLIASP